MFRFHIPTELAYKTEMNRKYKKLKHEKCLGFDLCKACMVDTLDAWKEMERYCKHDVLSTQEPYIDVSGWIRTQALARPHPWCYALQMWKC